ncbi:hypothetical protein [Fructobacillus tropaeoli]|uniref:Uncharacterized protein n=1 Tax=Fructobacillus tropaeoli TaxID=709323 RepID=A0A3F3HIH7_9LACO|nr:hypothetical protein [Fructobacillus tropaeoli]GAP04973.1 hypothetical protein FTRO_0140180 [Fructobacillus tropaeoli]
MTVGEIELEIMNTIEPLWKKESNTLYGVRVVLPQFDNTLNLFFEWHRLGRATTSRAINSYPSEEVETVLAAVRLIKIEKGITVSINR